MINYDSWIITISSVFVSMTSQQRELDLRHCILLQNESKRQHHDHYKGMKSSLALVL